MVPRKVRPLVEQEGDTRLVINVVMSSALGFHIPALLFYLVFALPMVRAVLATWLGGFEHRVLPPGEVALTLLVLLFVASLAIPSVQAIIRACVGLEVAFDNRQGAVLRNGRTWAPYGQVTGLEVVHFTASDGGAQEYQLRLRAGRRRIVLTRQLGQENTLGLGLRIARFSGLPFDQEAIVL